MNTSNLVNKHIQGWLSIAALLALVMAFGFGPAAMLAQTPDNGAGARAWVEYPTEGETLPFEPVRLVVYGTDAEGVARIELRINGNPLPAGEAEEQTFESERRLVRLEQQWVPEKEGKYILEARGVNSADGYGEPDFVEFCVGSCEGAATPTSTLPPRPTPTSTMPPSPTVFVRVTPTPTPTASPRPAPLSVTFTADNTQLSSGQCTIIRWNVQGPVSVVQINGQNVPPVAESQVCPPQTTNFVLNATGTDGTTAARELTIAVAAPPPTWTPTATATRIVPTPTATLTRFVPPPEAEIRFWADNDIVAAGTCTMLRWQVSNVKAYWVDGQPGTGGTGSRQVCPCETETHTLRVVKTDGTQQEFQVTIRVRGKCVTPTPTATTGITRPLQPMLTLQPLLPVVPVIPVCTPTRPIIR